MNTECLYFIFFFKEKEKFTSFPGFKPKTATFLGFFFFFFFKEKEKFTSCPGFELNTATLLGSLLCLSINCATRHPCVDRAKIVTYVIALLTGVNCLHSWCVLYLYIQ